MECKIHALAGSNLLAQPPGLLRLYELGHREMPLRPELHASLPAFIYGVGFQEEITPAYCWHGLRRGSAELAIIQYTLSGRGRLRFEGRESPVLARLAETCAAVLEERVESPYAASELAYGIVMALLGASTMGLGVSTVPTTPYPKFVSDVEQFCRANLTRPIGVDDLARVAKMSRFHFTRMFERARGISPGRYLASLRLEESLRLISRGGQTVKKVAEECGYGDANYFCKVFRKSFGVSPGAFRNGIQQNRARVAQVGR
jgi:AraC-like DNA-binding protein